MKCDVFPGETQAQFSPLLNQYQDRSRQKTKIRAANFMERQDSDMMDIQNKPPSLNVIPVLITPLFGQIFKVIN